MDNLETILNVATTAVNAAKRAEERVESLRQLTLFHGNRANDENEEEENNEDESASITTNEATDNVGLSWIDRIFDGVIPLLGKVFYMILWCIGLLGTSSCIYTLFYFMVMPSLVVQQDIYFDYMHTFSSSAMTKATTATSTTKLGDSTDTGTMNNQNGNNKNTHNSAFATSCTPGQESCYNLLKPDNNRSESHQKSSKTVFANESPVTASAPFNDEPPPLEDMILTNSKYLSPWPTAWVDLYASHSQWNAFDSSVIPDPTIATLYTSGHTNNKKKQPRLLHSPSRYWMDVNLILPESISNVNLGMFMIQMELFDTNKQPLAISKRPVLFPYSSGFVRHVRKVFGLIPLALGAIPEARTVTVSIMDQYVESKNRPLRYVRITLLLPPTDASHRSINGHGGGHNHHGSSEQQIGGLFGYNLRQVQVFGAELHIGKELSKLQYCMKIWFFTTTTIGIVTCFVLQLLIIFIVKMIWYNRTKFLPDPSLSGRTEEENDDDANSTSASYIFSSNVVQEHINDRRSFANVSGRGYRRKSQRRQSTKATGHQAGQRRSSKRHRSSRIQRQERRSNIPPVCFRQDPATSLSSSIGLMNNNGRIVSNKAVIPDSVAITRQGQNYELEGSQQQQQQQQRLLDRDHDDVIDFNENISYGSSTGPLNEDDNDEIWENLSTNGASITVSSTREGEEENEDDAYLLRSNSKSNNIRSNTFNNAATPIRITPNHLEAPSLD